MKTTSLVIASALSMAIASCAAEQFGSVEQFSNLDFADMVTKTLGWGTGLTLLNYGCYCGPGNPDDVVWFDDVDNCCRFHDEAYLAAPKKINGCNCNTQAYAYTVNNRVVTCAAQQVNACATYCCAADKAIVQCIAGAGPLDPDLANIDRETNCPLLDCRVDEDCDAGTWCDHGTCRPFCGGGGRFRPQYISADGVEVGSACEPPPESVDASIPGDVPGGPIDAGSAYQPPPGPIDAGSASPPPLPDAPIYTGSAAAL